MLNIGISGITENKVGANNAIEDIPEIKVGANNGFDGIPENKVGAKSVFEALFKLNSDVEGSILQYSVFEQALNEALEQFIKNEDGQKTLYTFYTEFLEAIEAQNSAAAKLKENATNVQLEDTHKLPAKISMDVDGIAKLVVALNGQLPRTVRGDLHQNVALELLFLHNNGKVTGAELRGFADLSVTGFNKHLTKLVHYGLIKKQAPLNYVLTDKSNHILLELFGILKTDQVDYGFNTGPI